MRTGRLLLAVAAAVAVTLAGCARVGGAGDAAPQPVNLEFTAATVEGGTFHGAELSGRPAVLWFWSPWCVTCAAQAPQVAALAEDFAGQVTVIGVAGLDDNLEAMRQFIDLTEVNGLPHLVDFDGRVWQRFGVTAQSTFVVLDADGAVVTSGHIRPTDLYGHLDQLVS